MDLPSAHFQTFRKVEDFILWIISSFVEDIVTNVIVVVIIMPLGIGQDTETNLRLGATSIEKII